MMSEEEGTEGKVPDYDKEKYVSYAEYLRDVNALKNKWIKLAFFVALGFAISYFNMYLIQYLEEDLPPDEHWWVNDLAADLILAYIGVLFSLIAVGAWIGAAKHKLYFMVYFAGFSAAGLIYTIINFANTKRASIGLYDFVVSLFLLLIAYIGFFKIWTSVKKMVAKPNI
ncbi:MAG: hypothetical protein ACFFCS_08395 [Candidatus Hodarchaeota archaeon]